MPDLLQPFSAFSGPRDARTLIVGEAFGENEARELKPFIGESGKELLRMLTDAWSDVDPGLAAWVRKCMAGTSLWAKEREAWMKKASVAFTNSFNRRPSDDSNSFDLMCGKRAEVGDNYPFPPLRQGKYVLPQHFPHLERLRLEIEAMRPNLIICAGNVACWAVIRATNIGCIRGNITQGRLCPVKVLPTFHPMAILHQWELRTIVVSDLRKAQYEAGFPEIRRPKRKIIVYPTFGECEAWLSRNSFAPIISCDTETRQGQITDIGFSTSPSEALVLTFVYPRGHPKDGQNVYETLEDEVQAWEFVEKVLDLPGKKLFQNGLYDLQYLWRYHYRPRNCTEDTMLLHHSLFPEMKKGLGFLGSIYTNESSWKLMRNHAEELKRDE